VIVLSELPCLGLQVKKRLKRIQELRWLSRDRRQRDITRTGMDQWIKRRKWKWKKERRIILYT